MKKCTLTDKRATAYRQVIALIISFAMLASTFYMGPVFADEVTDNSETGLNTEYSPLEETELLEDNNSVEDEELGREDVVGTEGPAGIEKTEGVETGQDAEHDGTADGQGETITGEPDSIQDDTETVELAGTGKRVQNISVTVSTSSTKKTQLKPDAYGRYTFNSSISKIRNYKTIKILISNPAESELSYSTQKMESNTGGSFLETKLIGRTINNPVTSTENKPAEGDTDDGSGGEGDEPGGDEPEPIDPNAVQVTEISVKVSGTGEAYISFSAKSSTNYEYASGKIIIKQTRSTKVISRSADVKSKKTKAKPINRLFKEKVSKIVEKNGDQKAVPAYRYKTRYFEVKRASGVSKTGYGAVQGGNSDGKYSYSALCQLGNKTYVKIVKTRLSDMKAVKTSGRLKLNHANDITYDPVNKRLVVTHNAVKRKRVSFVNTSTLKVTGYKDIVIPTTLKGATKNQLSKIKGFASVTYMTSGKYAGNYIAVISGFHDFLVLNKKFKPVEYISVSKRYKSSQVYYQGADCVDGLLYIGVYPRKKKYWNRICVYDMNGDFKGSIYLNDGFELENISHSGNTMYATLYKKVSEVWYTTKTVQKKVKVKKNGKTEYEKKNTVVWIKHKKKIKRSYIYKMKKVTL